MEGTQSRSSRDWGGGRLCRESPYFVLAPREGGALSQLPRQPRRVVSRGRSYGGMLTHPRCCAADPPTDMQCARAPGNRAILRLARAAEAEVLGARLTD